MLALEGPVDSLIVAASKAGRAPDARWGCAAATATCNPIAATTILATLVMSAKLCGSCYRFMTRSPEGLECLPGTVGKRRANPAPSAKGLRVDAPRGS